MMKKFFILNAIKNMDKKNGNYTFKMGFGCKVYECIGTYDLIINTIPSNVIDEDLLHKISLNTVILELASAPYGLNQDIANGLGLKYYILKGLPGVHRHITLGKELAKIIKECLWYEEVMYWNNRFFL